MLYDPWHLVIYIQKQVTEYQLTFQHKFFLVQIENLPVFICVSALKHNAQNQKQELRGKNTMVFNSSVKHCTEITTIKLHSIDP